MVISEKQRTRLRALKQLVSQSDIDELYGDDQACFEKVQTIAELEIPPEVDETVATFLGESDLDVADIDPVMKPVIQVIFQASRVYGWQVRQNVLTTKVEIWDIIVSTSSTTTHEPSPTIYQSSCHECGVKFGERTYICPNCYTQIIGR